MNEQLLLSNIRGVLIRLEETIIFALIERAQFCVNAITYVPNALGDATNGESLVGYLLHETERIHARLRRYTSPDERPFFDDLDCPLILPPLKYPENPLKPNDINVNAKVRRVYEQKVVPHICRAGDDGQYGSSSISDAHCLQALSKRVHYGKFVAESKFLSAPDRFHALIRAEDRQGILESITDANIEQEVLNRVRLKAETYGEDVGGNPEQLKIEPQRVVDVYAEWVIPMTKEVEVEYLITRQE